MSTETVEMNVNPRNAGKATSRRLRREGFVPAVVYGRNFDNKDVSIDLRMVEKYARPNTKAQLFKLKSEDQALNGRMAFIKDYTVHPSTRKYVHVDLYQVEDAAPVRVNVPVEYKGTPAGIKEGATFQPMLRHVVIEALPANVPNKFTLDVSPLNKGQSLHVSDLDVPENTKMITRSDLTLCVCAK